MADIKLIGTLKSFKEELSKLDIEPPKKFNKERLVYLYALVEDIYLDRYEILENYEYFLKCSTKKS